MAAAVNNAAMPPVVNNAPAQPPPVQQQQQPPPVHDHSSLHDLFPDHDLSAIIAQYGHMSSEALASHIMDTMAQIPKKKKAQKRRLSSVEQASAESDNESVQSAEFSDWEDAEDDLMVSQLVVELLAHLRAELKKAVTETKDLWCPEREWLMKEFPQCRKPFVDRIVEAFCGRLLPSAIACFLCENNFGLRVQRYAMQIKGQFWQTQVRPKKAKRYIKNDGNITNTRVAKEVKRFEELFALLQTKYPLLLQDRKLLEAARVLKAEKREQEVHDKMDCLVCYDCVPIEKLILCSPPTNDDMPSTSNAASNNLNKGPSVHTFCRSCVRNHAKAATEDMPMAAGGIGLKCMQHECPNPILHAEIRHILSKDIRKRLDERISEEIIGVANIEHLERCPKCNFAIEMDVPKEVNKVFHCFSCDYQVCRICEHAWDEDHFGVSCEELDKKSKTDKAQRELEKKLNEVVIRKCPQCSLTFTKESGCNKMTCRCGMTQCYVCKQSKITYDHFCQHLRDPNVKGTFKCTQCTKTCLLWEDASKKDDEKIKALMQGQSVEGIAATTEGPAELPPTALDAPPVRVGAWRANYEPIHFAPPAPAPFIAFPMNHRMAPNPPMGGFCYGCGGGALEAVPHPHLCRNCQPPGMGIGAYPPYMPPMPPRAYDDLWVGAHQRYPRQPPRVRAPARRLPFNPPGAENPHEIRAAVDAVDHRVRDIHLRLDRMNRRINLRNAPWFHRRPNPLYAQEQINRGDALPVNPAHVIVVPPAPVANDNNQQEQVEAPRPQAHFFEVGNNDADDIIVVGEENNHNRVLPNLAEEPIDIVPLPGVELEHYPQQQIDDFDDFFLRFQMNAGELGEAPQRPPSPRSPRPQANEANANYEANDEAELIF